MKISSPRQESCSPRIEDPDRPATGRARRRRGGGGGEMFAGDLGDESGCNPDADSRACSSGRLEERGFHVSLDFNSDLCSLPTQTCELVCKAWQRQGCGIGTDHDHRLLGEGLADSGRRLPRRAAPQTSHRDRIDVETSRAARWRCTTGRVRAR